MQRQIAAFLIAGLLLCVALTALAYETRKDRAQPSVNFEFVVAFGESGASFEAHHGTNWLSLGWGTNSGEGSGFWLDETGAAARESSMTGHKFLIHVEATPERIEFESKRGTIWKELSYSSTEPGIRRAVVNEYGIQSETVGY
jgi:hypothetical protein